MPFFFCLWGKAILPDWTDIPYNIPRSFSGFRVFFTDGENSLDVVVKYKHRR
jgi:hypothetical protein